MRRIPYYNDNPLLESSVQLLVEAYAEEVARGGKVIRMKHSRDPVFLPNLSTSEHDLTWQWGLGRAG